MAVLQALHPWSLVFRLMTRIPSPFSTDTDEPGYENLNNDHNNGDNELTHALSSDIESNEVIGEGNDSANGSNKGKRKVATPAILNLIDAKRKTHGENALGSAT